VRTYQKPSSIDVEQSRTDVVAGHIGAASRSELRKKRGRRTRGLVVLGVSVGGGTNNSHSEKKENTWQQADYLKGTIGRLGNGGGNGSKKEVCCGMRFWFCVKEEGERVSRTYCSVCGFFFVKLERGIV